MLKALSEAGQRLKVSDQDAASLRTEVQRLSAALAEGDAQRQAWASDGDRINRELAQYQEEVSCPVPMHMRQLKVGQRCSNRAMRLHGLCR